MSAGLFAPQDVAIFRLFVNKPYTKLYAVFLGIQMAFIYKHVDQTNPLSLTSFMSLKTNTKLRVFLWLLTVTVLGYVSLAPYPAQVSPMKWSNFHNALFITLTRPMFIMALMLLMVLLFTSEKCWLYRMLSHPVWLPMGRLTYAVYLIFPVVSSTLLSAMPMSLQLSYYVMFGLISYCFISSYTAALFINLMLENPIRVLIMSLNQKLTEKNHIDDK